MALAILRPLVHPSLRRQQTVMALAIFLASLSFFPLLLLPLLFYFHRITPRNNQEYESSPKLPPGPKGFPIIGNLHQLGRLPHRSLYKLSQKHGSLMYLKLGSMPTVVASSAETAKEFLKTHDLDCCTRPNLTSTSKLSYECRDIAFCPYGSLWREIRKICIMEFFSSKKVEIFRSIREQEIGRMIEHISCSGRSSVNLSAALLSLANDITCRAALGKRICHGESGLHKMLTESEAMLAGFFFADYVRALGWLDVVTGMRVRLERNFQDLDEFYQKVIDEHMERTGKREGEGEDTVDALLRIQKESTHLTNEHIKGILMNIFIGGSDTSASALEWTMTELMRHSEVMSKAQKEVRSLVGNKGKVEEIDLHRLNYLKCILKEVLRVHPPVPLLVQRETMQHCKIKGFDIPAKTRVLVNAFAIGREEGSWKNPEEFKPERFIDSAIDLKGINFELLPFGAGRRSCPGKHIGMAVVELALANLLYSFDWELPSGVSKEDIDMDEAIGLTVHRRSALHLVATKYAGFR